MNPSEVLGNNSIEVLPIIMRALAGLAKLARVAQAAVLNGEYYL